MNTKTLKFCFLPPPKKKKHPKSFRPRAANLETINISGYYYFLAQIITIYKFGILYIIKKKFRFMKT